MIGDQLGLQWTARTVPVSSLVPFEKNPRRITPAQFDALKRSIAEDGYHQRILVTPDLRVIGGHQRIRAMKELLMANVEVLVASRDLSDDQFKRILVRDNLAYGEWDLPTLQDIMGDDELAGLGFDMDQFGEPTPKVGEVDDDAVPELAVAKSAPRDVWLCGPHRVMCGDSTSAADMAVLMAGSQADMVWTDPPYNVAIQGKAGSIMNDDMGDAAFKQFLHTVYLRMFEAMRAGATIYVAHADSERVNFTEQFVAAGLKLAQVLIWVKQSATLSRQDFNWQHEPILYGWKEGAAHYFCRDFTLTTVIDSETDLRTLSKPQLIEIANAARTEEKTTVLRHNRPAKSDLHPTMKPVALVQRMVTWSSKPDDTVLDVFGGSGSTIIACEKVRRKARIMEMDPRYCDVIVKRWQDFTGQQARLESTGAPFSDKVAA